MLKRLLRHRRTQAILAAMLGRYLLFTLRSTRWTLHGDEHFAPHAAGRPAIVACWHERLPLVPHLWIIARRRAAAAPQAARLQQAHVLVSRHADGRFIGDVIARFGVGLIHGSSRRGASERGGAAGARALLACLAAGDHVVLTPDGPRGPRRVAAPGVAHLAAWSGVEVLPVAAQTSRRVVLPSWDRMVLPLPWGRGALVCGRAIAVEAEEWQAALPRIAQALTDAIETADRLVAAPRVARALADRGDRC
jgi:lysophospholipid acyltransferase (LPLAT)-like uncharacterized protein